MIRRADPEGPPLLLLLLPARLEDFELRERAEQLLGAPGAVAIEPARVSYRALAMLPPGVVYFLAHRQARRMRLPGAPRAIAIFDALQVPLAVALSQRHTEAEIWQLGPDPADALDSALVLDLGAAPDLLELWPRVEALGIESGRLGSERGL